MTNSVSGHSRMREHTHTNTCHTFWVIAKRALARAIAAGEEIKDIEKDFPVPQCPMRGSQ